MQKQNICRYTSKIYIIKIWMCVDCRLWKGSNKNLKSPQHSTYSQTHSHRTRPPKSRNREKWARHDDLPRHSALRVAQCDCSDLFPTIMEWPKVWMATYIITLCSSVRLKIYITWINFEVVIWDSKGNLSTSFPQLGNGRLSAPVHRFQVLQPSVLTPSLSQDGGTSPDPSGCFQK